MNIRERKFYQLTERVIKTKPQTKNGDIFHGILSRNRQMHKLFEKITKAAKTNASIYIFGETGVGKELVARAIHAQSARVNEPFIAVNVAITMILVIRVNYLPWLYPIMKPVCVMYLPRSAY